MRGCGALAPEAPPASRKLFAEMHLAIFTFEEGVPLTRNAFAPGLVIRFGWGALFGIGVLIISMGVALSAASEPIARCYPGSRPVQLQGLRARMREWRRRQ